MADPEWSLPCARRERHLPTEQLVYTSSSPLLHAIPILSSRAGLRHAQISKLANFLKSKGPINVFLHIFHDMGQSLLLATAKYPGFEICP